MIPLSKRWSIKADTSRGPDSTGYRAIKAVIGRKRAAGAVGFEGQAGLRYNYYRGGNVMKKYPASAAVLILLLTACSTPGDQPPTFDPATARQVIVDQFGWRTTDTKVAIMAEPVLGYNNVVSYTLPAHGAAFQVRRVSDDSVAFSGTVTRWNEGATDGQSGDKVCWADFSSLTEPGAYYLYDPVNDARSYDFEIRDNVYNDILKTAGRTFYYQRCGSAVTAAYGGNWSHAAACHAGANQDPAAHLWKDGADLGQPKDVHGGWHDAGDYNKYVPFTLETVWHLMTGYELNPAAFGDDWNIPESGNGVPDILDEIKFELDWLLCMQNADGSVCNRVGVLNYVTAYPHEDTQARYYTEATSWATSTVAGLAAHGARLFADFGAAYPGYAAVLRAQAESAWTWLEANASLTPASGSDGGGSGGGGSAFAAAEADSNAADDARRRLFAAAELFKTTGTAEYKTYFDAHYNSASLTDNGHHPITSGYFDPAPSWITQLAMIVYASTAGADPVIAAAITGSLQNGIEWNVTGNYSAAADPYRASMWDGHYCWGSNMLKAHWAFLPLAGVYLNVNAGNHALYRETAEEYLHYLHGRNPLSFVYLTNMGTKGANLGGDNPVMEVYHGWFHDGSPLYDGVDSVYGQAPGFLAGGPNQFFPIGDIIPPASQPAQKSFKDWNTGWNAARGENENSWEVTEPSIYTQAKYLSVLGYFCTP